MKTPAQCYRDYRVFRWIVNVVIFAELTYGSWVAWHVFTRSWL